MMEYDRTNAIYMYMYVSSTRFGRQRGVKLYSTMPTDYSMGMQSMISVKRVLENDLPNELKMSEARKRDAEKAAEQRLTMQNKKKLYYYYRNGDEKTKSEQHEGLGSLNLFLLPLSSPLLSSPYYSQPSL